MPRAQYNTCAVYGLFQQWIGGLVEGVSCRGGEGIFLDDKKVSGHAYCYRKDRVLHHGTLLVDSDLDRLRRALRAPELSVTTHAVSSNRASVANLSAWGARSHDVGSAAESAIEKQWGACASFAVRHDEEKVNRMRHWDQVFGGTPRFTTDLGGDTWVVRHGLVESRMVDGEEENGVVHPRGKGPRFVHEDLFPSGGAAELQNHPVLFPAD